MYNYRLSDKLTVRIKQIFLIFYFNKTKVAVSFQDSTNFRLMKMKSEYEKCNILYTALEQKVVTTLSSEQITLHGKLLNKLVKVSY